MAPRIDLVGSKFTRLLVIRQSTNDKHNRVRWECLCDCGNTIIVNTGDLNSKHTRSCGCLHRDTIAVSLKGKGCAGLKGNESPRWNSNLTEAERDRNRDANFRNWSKSIKERDAFTCCICNRVGGSLVSHHILNWADNKDKRYDLDNGICMCNTCHVNFHKIFGSRHNDESQLSEFVEMFDNGDFDE